MSNDYDDRETCPECHCCELTWVRCEQCDDGYSGHDCGEDCCACLYPEENVVCSTCEGKRGWDVCIGRCWKKEGVHAEVGRG